MNPPPGSVRRLTDAASNPGVWAGVSSVPAVRSTATTTGMARIWTLDLVVDTKLPSEPQNTAFSEKLRKTQTDRRGGAGNRCSVLLVSVLDNSSGARAGRD